MILKIDHEKCIGCGTCEALCPAVFKLNAQGKSEVIPDAKLEKHGPCIREAIEMCPVQAIQWARE